MCLILLAADKKPSQDILSKAWKTNSHGAGIAWVDEKTREAHYVKGINSLDELSVYVNKTELPFVIHFRLASVGGISDELTQPFEVTPTSDLNLTGKCKNLLMHNGTEPDWKKCLIASGIRIPLNEGRIVEPMSDSRAIAMIISNHKDLQFLYSATGKFVVIGYRNETDQHAFRYFGDFTEKDGIFYSNLIWEWKGSTYYGGHKTSSSYYHNTEYTDNDYSDCGVLAGVNIPQDTGKKKSKEKQTSQEAQEAQTPLITGYLPYTKKYRSLRRYWWVKNFPPMKDGKEIHRNTIDFIKKFYEECSSENHSESAERFYNSLDSSMAVTD